MYNEGSDQILLNFCTCRYTKVSSSNQSHEIVRRRAMGGNTPKLARHRIRGVAPSTTKRTNRQKTNTTAHSSVGPVGFQKAHHTPRVRSDILNEYTPPRDENIDYDLTDVKTSQSLFSARLQSVSHPPPNSPIPRSSLHTPYKSDSTLELDLTCSPGEFQSEWQGLPKGIVLSCRVENSRSLTDCHNHFQPRRFYVIASGVVGDEIKLFLVAQRQIKQPPLSNPRSSLRKSRCLTQIVFNATKLEMNAEIRCREKDQIPFFVSALHLKDLFGEIS